MTTTVCHLPWNTAYVEPNGDVYPCCHRQPGWIGNVYENRVMEIMAGERAVRQREMAEAGTLECFDGCTRSPRRMYEEAGGSPYPAPETGRLKELHLNISPRCNLRCVMCGQAHRSGLALDPQRIMQAVDWTQKPHLTLQGGEPLVIPEAYTLARRVIENTDSKITLLTNGTALSRKWEDLLLSRANQYWVSINAATKPTHQTVNRGSSWRKVIGSLRRLAGRRDTAGSPLKIVLRMTIVPQNVRELAAFVRFADAEGCVAKLKFGIDKATMPRWANENRVEMKKLYTDFINEAAASTVSCDTWRVSRFVSDQEGDLEYRTLKKP